MIKPILFAIFIFLYVSVAPICFAADDELLNDPSGIHKSTAKGGLERAKEVVIDALVNRASQTAGQSDYDLLNRLEFEYGFSEGGLDRYSVLSVQPLYSSQSGAHNFFMQGGYTNMDGRDTGGGDLVYRYMTPNKQALYGAHIGFDHQWPHHHSRMNAGVDYKTSLFGARATHYVGLSDWRSGEVGFEEKVMDGTDIELSGRLSSMPELELFTRGFHWSPEDDAQTNDGDDLWGYEVSAEYTPINAATFRVSGTDDNDRNDFSGEVAIRFNYRLGMGWDDLISTPSYDLSSVKERRFDKIRRERTIRMQQRSTNIASGPDCPNIGDTCADGSIFAGLSPDGNVRMFTTPADAGSFTWNDGFGPPVNTAIPDCGASSGCTTGEANTLTLVALNGGGSPAPYAAAEFCNALSAHGHSDWYLPSQNELLVMYSNLTLIGGFNTVFPARYWSSSEDNGVGARVVRFSDGIIDNVNKTTSEDIRCVRK